MVKNDPTTGKLTGRVPGKSIDIVRNPNWDKATDYRPAYLDEINDRGGQRRPGDGRAPRAERVELGVLRRRLAAGAGAQAGRAADAKDQVLFVPSGGTRYIAFNTTVKPFDNINVRKAIIAASDRNALRLTRGGEMLGDIATGWIPPGIPGFEEAGGLKQNTDLDYLANPAGDPAVAKKYMLAAKKEDPSLPIDANGKWTGGEKILTIATNADPGKKTAEVFQGQIEKLGFKLNFRIVPQDTLYTKFCGVPQGRRSAICPNVGWFKDFADPQSMLDADVQRQQHPRAGQRQLAAAQRPRDQRGHEGGRGRAASARSATRRGPRSTSMIAEQAPAIPWIWDKTALVELQGRRRPSPTGTTRPTT